MKLALALLVLAAPLSAQTPTDQKVVFNVVVTLVRTGDPSPQPQPQPQPQPAPPVVTPTPAPTPTPDPVPTPSPSPGGGCTNAYPAAVSSMDDVMSGLLQVQTLFSAAQAQNQISADVYNAGVNTLSIVRSDTSDVRDMIRIAGPTDVIAQSLTFVSAEIGTLPGLLGGNDQLRNSLAPLAASMQTSLGSAASSVGSSTCPQPSP